MSLPPTRHMNDPSSYSDSKSSELSTTEAKTTLVATLHPARCDSCLNEIRGVRYKIALTLIYAKFVPDKYTPAAAPDACSSLPRVFQDEELATYRYWTTIHSPVLSTVQGGHSCCSCSTEIFGTCYTCTEQDCPDFHLCTDCQRRNTHSQNHLMLQTSLPGYDPKESLACDRPLTTRLTIAEFLYLKFCASPAPRGLWAQRSSQFDETKNLVYLTVNLPISENCLSNALSDPQKLPSKLNVQPGPNYFEIEFFSENSRESTRTLTARSLFMVLFKKVRAEYWPRLTAEKDRHAHIRTDFDKWLGEDEQGGSESRDGEGLGV
ncbi:hypothetical protein B0H10DRAFT_2194960 [Mycena sp. CBHHK59/15]|nr:hypothetical protein B0H10DRAFT_2194960 [Mycena sp. CBHHK59/15]